MNLPKVSRIRVEELKDFCDVTCNKKKGQLVANFHPKARPKPREHAPVKWCIIGRIWEHTSTRLL